MKKDWCGDDFKTMVALGESTTAGGWSTDPDRCWVPLLGRLINDFQSTPMKVINSGIGANVISAQSPACEKSGKPAADERLDKHVIAHQPDLLVISYGLNDARGGTPIGFFQEKLVAIVHSVREHLDPVIMLPGPYYMYDFTLGGPTWSHADQARFTQFNAAIASVADTQACLYADLLAAIGDTDWMVHDDGVHQNDLGHRIVANRMFEVLAQHCSCLAKRTKVAEKNSPLWRDESTLRADYGY
ncbi:MAG: hypothetical protein CMJ20_07820 [Phycisphaeraceae bacterium]|nr:hypothetical protein [Phycisphaeraceae bacterium]